MNLSKDLIESDTVQVDIESTVTFVNSKEEQAKLCADMYRNVTSTSTELLCPAAWDSFYCWPPIDAGDKITVACDQIFSFLSNGGEQIQGYAHRECGHDGQWIRGNWTNYSDCVELLSKTESISPVTISYIIFICSIISLILLVISLFIFTYFKSLQCPRIRVHRNLILSLILHSLMMITIALPGIFDGVIEGLRTTNWLCKIILTAKMYSAMTCIYWMFVEGHLLHSSITVSVFKNETPFRFYYVIGWGIPFGCVLTWVVLMVTYQTTRCWKRYGKSPFIWVITGPMILALAVNTVFLINIIRILITKLQMSISLEMKQVKKAMKATALLFPLLGITHLLFCINPRDDAHLELAYMLTNAIFQSSQGLFVALLYCFLNSEVQSVLMNSYMRASMRKHPGRSLKHSRNTRVLGSITNTTSLSQSTEHVNGSATGKNKQSSQRHVSLALKPVEEESTDGNSEKNILIEKETSFIN